MCMFSRKKIFRVILQCFKKLIPIHLFPAVISKGNKEESSVIREGYLKGHKPPLCIGVKFSDTFKARMRQEKHPFCVISRREKDGAQSIISYMVYLIMVDISFRKNTDVFVLVPARLKQNILLQVISDASNIVISCGNR